MEVYFDNAATTPMRAEVISAMHEVMQTAYGNPSSTHGFGRAAKALLENARKSIAAHFNASAQEIIFTSGGTESDNMILRCAVKDLGVTTIISSPLEHHAILHALDQLEAEGVTVHYVDHDADGELNYEHLETLLAQDTTKKLVTLMYVNNEIGNLLDVGRVGALCKEHSALFHSDAVQSVGHFKMDMQELPMDFFSAAAHKFHGPKGVGFSFVRKQTQIKPFILGGAQERGLRAGTESVHNVVGMQKALDIAYAQLEEERSHILQLKSRFITELKALFPDVQFNGKCSNMDASTYTVVNVGLPVPEDKAGLLDFHLDLKGVACSKGSACQSGSGKGSHVIGALQQKGSSDLPALRFSFSGFNTEAEVAYVMEVLREFKER
ncbi:MAG: cysteine desulfurase family protein [Flavobacteriaceae bacterium]